MRHARRKGDPPSRSHAPWPELVDVSDNLSLAMCVLSSFGLLVNPLSPLNREVLRRMLAREFRASWK